MRLRYASTEKLILSPCHLVTLSPCHLVTLSPCHLVTLSPCHLVTLSPCHLVTLSPCGATSGRGNMNRFRADHHNGRRHPEHELREDEPRPTHAISDHEVDGAHQ